MGIVGMGFLGIGALVMKQLSASSRKRSQPEFYWSPAGFYYSYGRQPARAPTAGRGRWVKISAAPGRPRAYWRWYTV
jgi:hypothetical protein